VDGQEEKIAVHHGFLYFRDNQLVILADIAEVASQIDAERAEAPPAELERAGRKGGRPRARVHPQAGSSASPWSAAPTVRRDVRPGCRVPTRPGDTLTA
jgi:hypothetical protein